MMIREGHYWLMPYDASKGTWAVMVASATCFIGTWTECKRYCGHHPYSY